MLYISLNIVVIISLVVRIKPESNFCQNVHLGPQLGRGSFGSVFNVTIDGNADRNKLVAKEFLGPKSNTHFEREHHILSQLRNTFVEKNRNHGNIRARFSILFGSCSIKGQKFIFTDYIPVGLEQIIPKERTMTKDVGIIYSLLQAVSQIHAVGFVHLDLKPENVRVTSDNEVKLIDFGVSHQILTPSGSSGVGGTTVYMAPEALITGAQILNSDQYKVDTWGVGTIAFEILMRRRLTDDNVRHKTGQCLSKYFDKQKNSHKHQRESFRKVIYIRTKIALNEPAITTTAKQYIDPSNPTKMHEAAMQCLNAADFEESPRLALKIKLNERAAKEGAGQAKNSGALLNLNFYKVELVNLLFGKLLKFFAEQRATIDEAIKVKLFHKPRDAELFENPVSGLPANKTPSIVRSPAHLQMHESAPTGSMLQSMPIRVA